MDDGVGVGGLDVLMDVRDVGFRSFSSSVANRWM